MAQTVTDFILTVAAGAAHQLVYTVALPLLALIVILLLESVGTPQTRTEWWVRSGFDMTIAALGMTGHLFGDPVFSNKFGQYHAAIVMATVLLVIACSGVTLHVQRSQFFLTKPDVFRVRTAVIIGFAAVALVAFVASWGGAGPVPRSTGG